MCRRGVRTVYVYQVDNRKIERHSERKETVRGGAADPRWVLAGGILIAASIFFGFFDMHIEELNMSMSISGWDLLSAWREYSQYSPRSAVLVVFMVSPAMGAVMAASSWSSFKGYRCLPDMWIKVMSVLTIAIPIVLFVWFCSQIPDEVSYFSMMLGDMSMRPGPGLLMQVAGGAVALLTYWRNRR